MSPDPGPKRLWIRFVGAPLLIAALLGILWHGYQSSTNIGLRAVVGLLSLVALHEVYAMMRLKGLKPAAWIGLAGLLLAHVAAAPRVERLVHATPEGVAAGTAIAVLLWMVFRYGAFEPSDAGATLLGFGWLWLTTYMVRWVITEEGGLWWLLFLLATNKGSDMAAFCAGKLVGRHKLAPVVSPNKTWEGSIAGFVAGGGLGTAVLFLKMRGFFPGAMETILVLAAAMTTVAAQLGDLVKSAVKRWAGVKDSGRLLPEFGGALDMIDSFILSAPVAWLFAVWLGGR